MIPDFQRPNTQERPDYEPAGPQEEFIVPLLRRCIETAFAAYAAPAPPLGKALDVGCGRQPFRRSLEAMGYSYCGLDVAQNPEGNVDFVAPIDEPLPQLLEVAGPFEFILCTEVLEHVADWDMAFKNLAALMAPGGKTLITCPHFYQLHEEPYDFWRPTPYAIRFFASRVGLKVLFQEAAGDAWDILGTLLANTTTSSANRELSSRILNRIVRLIHQQLFKSLRSRTLQSRVLLKGPLFMSNVVVLERSP